MISYHGRYSSGHLDGISPLRVPDPCHLVQDVTDGGEDGVPELAEDPGPALDFVVTPAVELPDLTEQILLAPGAVGQKYGVA